MVLIDMTDSDDSLRELSRIAIGKGLSLLVASSEKEVGRYIETFKLYENKPADMLQVGSSLSLAHHRALTTLCGSLLRNLPSCE